MLTTGKDSCLVGPVHFSILKKQRRSMLRVSIFGLLALFITVVSLEASQFGSPETEKWAGIWFTCEFAQSRTPLHD